MGYGLYSQLRSTCQRFHLLNFKAILLMISVFCVAYCLNIGGLSGQSVIETINLGPVSGNGVRPHSVVMNPETNRVYVANIGIGYMWLILKTIV